jgi:RNA polymerase sigma factor (sigma-70 family)
MGPTSQRSWTEFFERERSRLVGYVRSLIDDAADRDSEDILQDVIAGILEKPDITGPIQNTAAYVYQALRNRVVDYLRRRKKNESMDAGGESADGGRPALAEILADLKYDAALETERREINRDLNKAIGRLDEYDRDIFIATEFQGLTFQELSDLWDVPIGTLLSRKSRALKKLQKELVTIDPVHYTELLTKINRIGN